MPPDDVKPAEYMSSAPAAQGQGPKARRQSEGGKAPVIPDTCNVGIALRIAAFVHSGALVVTLAQSGSASEWLVCMGWMLLLLEPVLLASLGTLCMARKVVNGLPRPWQWATVVLVPACLMLIFGGLALPWMQPEATPSQLLWWFGIRVFIVAAASVALVELFRLRARAYSPSFSEARLQALQADPYYPPPLPIKSQTVVTCFSGLLR